jgi:hypothetical protein
VQLQSELPSRSSKFLRKRSASVPHWKPRTMSSA